MSAAAARSDGAAQRLHRTAAADERLDHVWKHAAKERICDGEQRRNEEGSLGVEQRQRHRQYVVREQGLVVHGVDEWPSGAAKKAEAHNGAPVQRRGGL